MWPKEEPSLEWVSHPFCAGSFLRRRLRLFLPLVSWVSLQSICTGALRLPKEGWGELGADCWFGLREGRTSLGPSGCWQVRRSLGRFQLPLRRVSADSMAQSHLPTLVAPGTRTRAMWLLLHKFYCISLITKAVHVYSANKKINCTSKLTKNANTQRKKIKIKHTHLT